MNRRNFKQRSTLLYYREHQTINFCEALTGITTALDTCIEAMRLKTKYTTSNFKPWEEKVLAKVKEKTTELKQKVKYKQTKLVLNDLGVKKHLEELHRKNVIVTIYKA